MIIAELLAKSYKSNFLDKESKYHKTPAYLYYSLTLICISCINVYFAVLNST